MKNVDYIYVGLQFGLFLVFVLLPNRQFDLAPWAMYAGGVFTILGLLIVVIAIMQLNKNLSPFPSPKSDSSLVTNGLYGIVRHPIYSGILMTCLGYSMYQGSAYKLAVTVALAILFHYKSNFEEKLLLSKFPEYTLYTNRTSKIIPYVW